MARGTSGTAYAALASILLATGEEFVSKLPRGKQLDWEAMLISDHRLFLTNVRSWFSIRIPTNISQEWLQGDKEYNMDVIFRTPRDVLKALSGSGCLQNNS